MEVFAGYGVFCEVVVMVLRGSGMWPGPVSLLRIEGGVGWCICRDCSCFCGLFLLSV